MSAGGAGARRVRRRWEIILVVVLALVLGALPASPSRGTTGEGCPMPAPVGPIAPLLETPTYDPTIPRPEVLPGFGDRPVTSAELKAYVELVDAASDRVITGTLATTWQGRDVPYALVGSPASLANLDRVAAANRRLRDPERTSATEAGVIARSSPAIVWFVANMHPVETAGGDAALKLIYELAARNDREVKGILDNLVVGVVPTLNPDGRNGAHLRGNAYGFDLNRDFYTLSQPETSGLIELLRRYPPVLVIDAHENSTSGFYSPPSANPVFHEAPGSPLRWIDEVFGPEVRAEFDSRRTPDPLDLTPDSARNWWVTPPAGDSVYDFFYQGTLDTMASTAFGAVGILFEKGILDPPRQRMEEQFVAAWVHIRESAEHKVPLLEDYYQTHVEAVADGRAGRLEPNEPFPDRCDITEGVAPDLEAVPDAQVRHYFIADRRSPVTARLIDRLLRFDVEVYTLEEDLAVPNLRSHSRGGPGEPGIVPAGSYWIPMAQARKRWVQALLGEDTYAPTAVPMSNEELGSAWSQPLLLNLEAWLTGDELEPVATRIGTAPTGRVVGPTNSAASFWFAGDSGEAVAAALELVRQGATVRRIGDASAGGPAERGAFVVDAGPDVVEHVQSAATGFGVVVHAHPRPITGGEEFTQPRVAVYQPPILSKGHLDCLCDEGVDDAYLSLRFLLTHRWKLPHTLVTATDIASGALTNFDVLVVTGDLLVLTGEGITDPDPLLATLEDEVEAGPGGGATETDALFGTVKEQADPVTGGGVPFNPLLPRVREWVDSGGVFVGMGRGRDGTPVGGTAFATTPGPDGSRLSSATQKAPTLRYTGNLVRVALDEAHPLAAGVGAWVYSYLLHEEPLLEAHEPTDVVAGYPDDQGEFHYSGYIGIDRNEREAAFAELAGKAVVTDEALGSGRVVLFSGEPNHRAMTEGMQLLLANALAYQTKMPRG